MSHDLTVGEEHVDGSAPLSTPSEDANRSLANERALNALLRASLSRKPLNDILLDSLDILLSVEWLAILPKAGVFLAAAGEDVLELVAERNLSRELTTLCSRVAFGQCLCGRAAESRRILHAGCVDHRHDIRFSGMQPHGHYNVPILDNGQVLGVLVLYLPHGRASKKSEMDFLEAVADILSLTIRQKRLEDQLASNAAIAQQTTSQLATTFASMPQGVTIFSADQRLVICNERYREIYGLSLQAYPPGTAFRSIVQYLADSGHLDMDVDRYVHDHVAQLVGGTWSHSARTLKDGRRIAVRARQMPDGGWVSTHDDVTQTRLEQEALLEAHQELIEKQFAIDQAVIVAITDVTGTIIYANDNFCTISGYLRDELLGANHRLLKSGVHPTAFFRDMYRTIANGEVWRGEVCNRAKDGSFYWVDTTIVPQLNLDGRPISYMAIRVDITARKLAEEQTRYVARHDSLTGLHNRTAFNEALRAILAGRGGEPDQFVLMMIDLDGFKNVNDTLGHAAGDALLKTIGKRLKALLRDDDIAARLGGDEFAIVQRGVDEPREAGVGLALSILEAVGKPMTIDGNDIFVGASIGIATAPEDGRDAGTLLKRADLALYQVKAEGRGNFRFFDRAMEDRATERSGLIGSIRTALAHREFELQYQPIIDAKTQRICAAEALLRWRHPAEGLLEPSRFIPLAEESGLMVPLGDWVLEQACADAVKWPADIRLAVNLSATQFRSSRLLDVILCALLESGLPPERLELEITESALIHNPENHKATIEQLRNIGVSIALDDFGTGFSSLSYLTMFPFDRIKIDRSFIADLTQSPNCAAIVASILTLARGLDLSVTAEGIETTEQFELLRAAGVQEAQGFLFGKATPVEKLSFVLPDGNARYRVAS